MGLRTWGIQFNVIPSSLCFLSHMVNKYKTVLRTGHSLLYIKKHTNITLTKVDSDLCWFAFTEFFKLGFIFLS